MATALSLDNQQKKTISQKFSLVWLHSNSNRTKDTNYNALSELKDVVHNVDVFTNQNECVDFINDLDGVKIFLVV